MYSSKFLQHYMKRNTVGLFVRSILLGMNFKDESKFCTLRFASEKHSNYARRKQLTKRTLFLLCLLGCLFFAGVSNAQKMYWKEIFSERVRYAKTDGTDVRVLIPPSVGSTEGIALDLEARKVYWTTGSAIRRSNLDGTNVQDVVTGLSQPMGLAIGGGYIYWSEPSIDRIRRRLITGVTIQNVYIAGSDWDPWGIALDLDATPAQIYWVQAANGQIRRRNADGSGLITTLVTGLAEPQFIALDVDDNRMYWTEIDIPRVRRALRIVNPTIETLVNSGLTNPSGIALDIENGKMYWGDYGTTRVQRANFDGSSIENLVTSTDATGIALDPAEPFVTTLQTSDGSIVIPAGSSTFNYEVYYENTTDPADNGYEAAITGSYTISGLSTDVYRVEISGIFPHLSMGSGPVGNAQKLRTIEQWGDIAWGSMEGAFDGCFNMTYNATTPPDLTSVTNMSNMFATCQGFNGNINNWDVSTVTNMEGMFNNALIFNQPLNNWDVSDVENMRNMFFAARAFNQPLDDWNVSNVEDMFFMFAFCDVFNQDLRNWEISATSTLSNVTTMQGMFFNALVYNQPLDTWDVGNVTDMSRMFEGASDFDQSLGDWDIGSITGPTNSMETMLDGTALSVANYDATLSGWAALGSPNIPNGITLGAGTLNYCAAAADRAFLVGTEGWTITDGGEVCPINTFTGSGNWSEGIRWSLGTPPNPGDDVIIDGAATLDVSPSVGAITITTGNSLNLNNNDLTIADDLILEGDLDASFGAPTIFIGGDWVNNSTGFNPGTGSTVDFNGTTATQDIDGSQPINFFNLVVSKSVTDPFVQLFINTTVNGDFSITSTVAELNPRNNNFTVSGITSIDGLFNDNNNSGVNTFGGTVNVNAPSGRVSTTTVTDVNNLIFEDGIVHNGLSFDVGGVTFNGNQSILGSVTTQFDDILIGAGNTLTKANVINMVVSNSMDGVDAASTFVNGINSNFSIQGDLFPTNGSADFSAAGNTVNFGGSPTQDIPAGQYHRIFFAPTSATKTLLGNISVSGNLIAFANVTLDAATNNATVEMNGTADQDIDIDMSTVGSFYNLVINNAAPATNDRVALVQPIRVANALTLTNGRVQLGANNFTYNGTEANLTRINGWVETDGTGVFLRSIAGTDFTFPVGDDANYQPIRLGTSAANASVRFGAPSVAVPNSGVGSWFVNNTTTSDVTIIDPQGGTIISGTSEIGEYTTAWGAVATTYPVADNYRTANYPFSGVAELGVFTSSTTFIFNGAVDSDWSDTGNWSGGALPGAGDDIIIQGDAAIDAAAVPSLADFGSLTIIVSFSLDLNGNDLTVTDVTNDGTFTTDNATVNISGDFANNGTFTNVNGTVNFNGAGNQAFSRATYGNLNLAGGSGTKTADGVSPLTINQNFTIGAGTTFEPNGESFSVNGDFDIQGAYINNTGLSSVFFGGTTLQTINVNDQVVSIFHFNLTNSAGAQVLSSIGGELRITDTFVLGANSILNTSATPIIFEDGISVGGAPFDNTKHINGPVIKEGTSPVTLPLGDGNKYGPLQLSSPSAPVSITAQYFGSGNFGSITTTSPNIDVVQPEEYWEIFADALANIQIQFNYDDAWRESYITDPTNLRIAQTDGSGFWNGIPSTGLGGAISGDATASSVALPNPTAGLDSRFTFANNLGGTNTFTATLPTQPVGVTGLWLDGTEDFASIIDASGTLNLSTLTLEAWIKPTDLSGTQSIIHYGTTGSAGYGMSLLGDQLQFSLYGVADYTTASIIPDPNAWYHVAVTYTNAVDGLNFYLNGVLVDTQTPAANIGIGTSELNIGQDNTGQHFGGQIDEVRIFNTVRTQTQIQADLASTTLDGAYVYVDFNDDLSSINPTTAQVGSSATAFIASLNGAMELPRWAWRVTNTLDDVNPGSLRYAITEANTDTDKDYIDFSISGAGAQTISLTSAIPTISEAVIIDGASQEGWTFTTPVSLTNGAFIANGLTFNAGSDDSEVYGLDINSFTQQGIEINNGSDIIIGASNKGNTIRDNGGEGIRLTVGDNLTIQGNIIGLNSVGDTDAGNGGGGIVINDNTSTGHTVGGAAAGERNVISGNANAGIVTQGVATILGNYIGTNAAGNATITNGNAGIAFQTGATGSTVGDGTVAGRNVVSGNFNGGIRTAVDVTIDNNLIGTNFDGSAELGNGTSIGVFINGGTTSSTIRNNVVSGHTTSAGIRLNFPATVTNNIVGLNLARDAVFANVEGIYVDANDCVIGNNAGGGNEIAGNSIGIFMDPNVTNTQIQGNYIGTNSALAAGLGNTGNGIRIQGSAVENANDNIIGGTNTGDANTIIYNGGFGISVTQGIRNEFIQNVMYCNTSGGIELTATGNNDKDIPIITSALDTDEIAGTGIVGDVIHVYRDSDPASCPTGSQEYLGTATVDGAGNWTITSALALAVNDRIVATQTGTTDGTSAFSAVELVVASPLPTQPVGNRGMYFDGVDDYVAFDNTDLKSKIDGLSTLTVEAWIKHDGSSDGVIFSHHTSGMALSGANVGLFLSVSASGALSADLNYGESNVTGSVITPNTWHHVAAVFDGTLTGNVNRFKMYVDGVEQSVTFGPTPIPATIGTLSNGSFVGGRFFGASLLQPYGGQIDEVKVFNTARASAQIQSDLSSTATNTPGLVGYWNFDQSTGTTANDVQTNVTANDGTLIGATLPLWALRVKNTNATGTESLADVITDANSLAGKNYIDFSIPTTDPNYDAGTQVWTIQPDAFYDINDEVVIDGYSAQGSSPNTQAITAASDAQIRIQIDGFVATNTPFNVGFCFDVGAQSEFYGLSIYNYNTSGVGSAFFLRNTADGSTISGNYVGTDATGSTTGLENRSSIYLDRGSSNTIGGALPEDRNIISGSLTGVFLFAPIPGNATGNQIIGNFIGNNGTVSLGSAGNGITLRGVNTSANTVGSSTVAAERNVISGNGFNGILIDDEATNNDVLGNYIGVQVDGVTALGNGENGVHINTNGVNNNVGDGTVGGQNIIANSGTGVGVSVEAGATQSTIRYNAIYDNTAGGIQIAAGSNADKAVPVITSATTTTIEGTCETGDVVEVYDNNPSETQGRSYLGNATVTGTTWSFAGTFTSGNNITATATDASGNTSEFSTELTVTTAPLPTQPVGNNGIYFDGVDDYVAIPGSATNATFGGDFTIEAWIKLNEISGNNSILDGNVGNNFTLLVRGTNDLALVNTISGQQRVGFSGFNLNEWYHVAVTFNDGAGDEIRFYVNGVLENSGQTINPFNFNASTPLSIGGRSFDNTQFFDGQIDEVKVFNTVRSLAEIQADMNSTTPDPSLVGYWNFDDGTGTNADDLGTGNNDGTLTNDPLWAFRVTNTLDDTNPGSLRYAITQANTDADKDYVDFSIEGAGVQILGRTTALPDITEPVIIDGYSQPGSSENTAAVGNNAVLNIQLERGIAASVGAGLFISASNSEVYGLIIHDFGNGGGGNGIRITGTGNTIAGCQVGIDALGNVSATNTERNTYGIWTSADGTIIGLPTLAGRNTIAGNQFQGIRITDNSTGSTIQNNYIGTNPDGNSVPANNQGNGLALINSNNIVVGGTSALERNVIAGHNGYGIRSWSTGGGHLIRGNYIGIGADGSTVLGNGTGVLINNTNDNVQVGGVVPGQGNIIANNTTAGVVIDTGTGHVVRGNSMFANPIGINVVGGTEDVNGYTANDTDDADTGNNNLQNYPEITGIVDAGSGTFDVSLEVPNNNLTSNAVFPLIIDFYRSNPTERQGNFYLGSITNYAINDGTPTTINVTMPALSVGETVVATATDANGNTSEFSVEVVVGGTLLEIFVNDDASGANAGTSWADAFTDLQSALDVAASGTKIYVAEGTYKPSAQYNFTNGTPITATLQQSSFKLEGGIELYGGFDATEPATAFLATNLPTTLNNRSAANIEATVLSGDVDNNSIVDAGNAWHVVYTHNTGADVVVVNGFVITEGYTNNGFDNRGAGWLNYANGVNNSISIERVAFKNNRGNYGAGMANQAEGSSSINADYDRVEFIDNQTIAAGAFGAGLYNNAGAGNNISLSFSNATFIRNINNTADGGAIINLGFTSLDLTNCLFYANAVITTGREGGGIYNANNANVAVRNAIFWENTAGVGGIESSWFNATGATTDIAFSLVEEANQTIITTGNYAGTTVGAGMIYATDPLFTDPATDDYTLQTGSPALDVGDNASIPAGITNDLAGNARIQDGTVDLGAYEGVTAAVDFYWVGDGADDNWSNTDNWSDVSDGDGTLTTDIPTATDDVFFDANSFAAAGQSVIVDGASACAAIDWTDATNNPTFQFNNDDLNINGDFTLIPGMSVTTTGTGEFVFNNNGGTIESGTQTLPVFTVNAETWTLASNTQANVVSIETGATLDMNNQDLSIAANLFVNNGTLNQGTGAVIFNGTDATAPTGQQIAVASGTITFNNLVINNTATAPNNSIEPVAGVSTIVVNNSIDFNGGILEINNTTLSLGNTYTNAGTPNATSHIATNGTGTVAKGTTGTGNFTFPLGDGTLYTPLDVNLTAVTGIGTVEAQVVNDLEPNIPNPTVALTRYWTLSSTGLSGITATLTANYNEVDDVVGTETDYLPGTYDGITWTTGLTTDISNASDEMTFGVSDLNVSLTAGEAGAFVSSTVLYWTGNAADLDWTNVNNWSLTSGGTTPITGDYPGIGTRVGVDVIFDGGGSNVCNMPPSTTLELNSITIETGYTSAINQNDAVVNLLEDFEQNDGTYLANSGTINIQGNWRTLGGSFDPNTSTVAFVGTTDQELIDGLIDLRNLTINKPSGVVNLLAGAGNVRIAGVLNLQNGLVEADLSNFLQILPTGSQINGGANSYIKGGLLVETSGPLPSFTYHIGDDGIYAPVTMTGLTGTDFVFVDYVHADIGGTPQDPSVIDLISPNEHWQIAGSTGQNASFELQFSNTSPQESGVTDLPNLRIVQQNIAPANTFSQVSTNPGVPINATDGTISTGAIAVPTGGDDEFFTLGNNATLGSNTFGSICDPVADEAALTAFYSDTNGASWNNSTGWLGGLPLSGWFGVATNAEGCVTEINLPSNDLSGNIPATIADLADLERIDLANNPSVSGEIPIDITTLPNVDVLVLTNTNICTPDADPSFTTWAASLSTYNASGITCEPIYYWVGLASTAWDDVNNWSFTSGGAVPTGVLPPPTATVIVDGGSMNDLDVNISTTVNEFFVEVGAPDIVVFSGLDLTLTGEFVQEGGVFNVEGGANLILEGDISLAGTSTFNVAGGLQFTGISTLTNTTGTPVVVENLNVSGSVTLGDDITVLNTATLSGEVITSSNRLQIGDSSPATLIASGGFVDGNLGYFVDGTANLLFPFRNHRMEVEVTGVTTLGNIVANFDATNPNPITEFIDDGEPVSAVFGEGFFRMQSTGAEFDYDVQISNANFSSFPIGEKTRVVTRTGSLWLGEGNADGNTGRSNLSINAGQTKRHTLANSCTDIRFAPAVLETESDIVGCDFESIFFTLIGADESRDQFYRFYDENGNNIDNFFVQDANDATIYRPLTREVLNREIFPVIANEFDCESEFPAEPLVLSIAPTTTLPTLAEVERRFAVEKEPLLIEMSSILQRDESYVVLKRTEEEVEGELVETEEAVAFSLTREGNIVVDTSAFRGIEFDEERRFTGELFVFVENSEGCTSEEVTVPYEIIQIPEITVEGATRREVENEDGEIEEILVLDEEYCEGEAIELTVASRLLERERYVILIETDGEERTLDEITEEFNESASNEGENVIFSRVLPAGSYTYFITVEDTEYEFQNPQRVQLNYIIHENPEPAVLAPEESMLVACDGDKFTVALAPLNGPLAYRMYTDFERTVAVEIEEVGNAKFEIEQRITATEDINTDILYVEVFNTETDCVSEELLEVEYTILKRPNTPEVPEEITICEGETITILLGEEAIEIPTDAGYAMEEFLVRKEGEVIYRSSSPAFEYDHEEEEVEGSFEVSLIRTYEVDGEIYECESFVPEESAFTINLRTKIASIETERAKCTEGGILQLRIQLPENEEGNPVARLHRIEITPVNEDGTLGEIQTVLKTPEADGLIEIEDLAIGNYELQVGEESNMNDEGEICNLPEVASFNIAPAISPEIVTTTPAVNWDCGAGDFVAIQLAYNDAEVLNYEWQDAEGNTIVALSRVSGESVSLEAVPAGTYTLIITVENNENCAPVTAEFIMPDLGDGCESLITEGELEKLCALKESLPADAQQTLGWPTCPATSTNPDDYPGIALNRDGMVRVIDLSKLGLENVPVAEVEAFDELIVLDVSENELTFEDLEQIAPVVEELIANNQASVGEELDEVRNITQDITLTIPEGITGTRGLVTWFFVPEGETRENGSEIGNGVEITVENARPQNDQGTYYAEITHPDFPEVIIFRRDIDLMVTEKMIEPDRQALIAILRKLIAILLGNDTGRVEALEFDENAPAASWPGVTQDLDRCVGLDLSSFGLQGEIPQEITQLTALRRLSFFDNQLEGQLPEGWENLTDLTYLDLDKNNLSGEVPRSITQLTSLKTLWLSRNAFTQLPNEIDNLSELEFLLMQENQFEQLPQNLENLDNLKVLDLSSNKLTEFLVSAPTMARLEQLNLSGNQIENIDLNMSQLPSLITLDLSENRLTALPEGITNSANLERLFVRRNYLDFADLEPLDLAITKYSPQNRQTGDENRVIPVGSSVTLSANMGGTQNRYQWFKDGQRIFLQPQLSESYQINTMAVDDAGEYECLVTNALVPDLTLRTRFITLTADCGDELQVEVQASGLTEFCANDNVFVTMQASTVEGATYQWLQDGRVLSLANDNSYSAFAPGNYQVQATLPSGCAALSEVIAVQQAENELAVEVEVGEDNILRAIANDAEVSIVWLRDGSEISGANEAAFTPELSGNYSVRVTNAQGCTAISAPQLVSITSLGEEFETGPLSLFPNPTRDRLTVEFPEIQRDVTLTLRQTDGKEVAYYQHQNVEAIQLNLEHLPSGVYLLEINSEQGHVMKRVEKK